MSWTRTWALGTTPAIRRARCPTTAPFPHGFSVLPRSVGRARAARFVTVVGHGQIWWADLERDKVRPVLILTRGWVAPRLSRVLVAPITTRVRGIHCEVLFGQGEGVEDGSAANLDNVQLVDRRELLGLAGRIRPERWSEVCAAMAHVIACER